jgi:prophage regulatory protein
MEKQLLRLPAVLTRTAESRASWYAAVKRGDAPRPVKLNGGRAAAWVSTEIDSYIDRQIAARDASQRTVLVSEDDSCADVTTGCHPTRHPKNGVSN